MSRKPVYALRDIERSCARVVRYTEGLERDEVFSDESRCDAVFFNLYVIGEAVKQLPQSLRDIHPEIPWREIAGLRDVIAHAYFSLDLDILWSAIREDVPTLLKHVRDILSATDAG